MQARLSEHSHVGVVHTLRPGPVGLVVKAASALYCPSLMPDGRPSAVLMSCNNRIETVVRQFAH